ncbi:hypothetical protein CCMSSC00406_0003398 [Pleurotus cornucopiae]|uniref:Uncharacterized protein n=1 Tax=Pleurotus cornucopiae TaxID=5321 RepID=A0ACB7JAV6_PLECO|nr:hypothetical protein CCMSSC00406_0003398 [Pleurotus cornucopiae]
MFFSLASIALLAVSVAAQGGFPQCAIQCLDPTQSVNGCGPTDNACLCNDTAFISSTTACIDTNCEGDDVANAQSAARSLCAAVGVTLTSTPASEPTSSSVAAPPTSSSGSSSVSGSSSAPTSTAPASSTGSATNSRPAPSPNAAEQTAGLGSGLTFRRADRALTCHFRPAPAQTSNAASFNGVNSFAGIAALGLAALAL